jgi:serine/threonine protein kinase
MGRDFHFYIIYMFWQYLYVLKCRICRGSIYSMMRSNDLINENFAGYHITAEHSSTRVSTTFLGESIVPTTGIGSRRVLIKMLSVTDSATLQERQEILQKIVSLQQLHHPHILPILSVGMHNDIPYMIMEYLETQSLNDGLQSRAAGQPVAIEEALLILSHVGQALYYAHQQQVIHGYLRPQDILFTEGGDALVTGFHHHILQMFDNSYDTIPMELPMYQAPEQILGVISEKSDQYVLACIAYDLFTGSRAFMIPSPNAPGMYYKTRALIPPSRLNPALPLYIEDAILKAMSREPEQRYRSIATFLNALRIPLPTGTRDLIRTDLFPEETQQRVSAVSFTPVPESLPHEPVKQDAGQDVIVAVALDENRAHTDILAQMFPHVVESIESVAPMTPATNARVVDMSGRYLYPENAAILNMLPPPGIGYPPLVDHSSKQRRTKYRPVLIMIACLVAIILLFAALLAILNGATLAKKSRTSPPITSVAATATAVHHGSGGNGPSGTPASTQSSQGQDTNSAQGQGTAAVLTPVPTVRSAGFLQGVTAISASQAELWFAPNGWTATNMVLYYYSTGQGQGQQNVPMLYNSVAGQWQYMLSGLSPAQTIVYWFTYQQSGTQYISGTYTYIVSAAGTATPISQPSATPSGCASSFSQGVNSSNVGRRLSQAQFWFSPCGWTPGYVIMNYAGARRGQQSSQMTYNSAASQWQYTLDNLQPGQTITYWFTYQRNGTQYTSPIYAWTVPGRGFHG